MLNNEGEIKKPDEKKSGRQLNKITVSLITVLTVNACIIIFTCAALFQSEMRRISWQICRKMSCNGKTRRRLHGQKMTWKMAEQGQKKKPRQQTHFRKTSLGIRWQKRRANLKSYSLHPAAYVVFAHHRN